MFSLNNPALQSKSLFSQPNANLPAATSTPLPQASNYGQQSSGLGQQSSLFGQQLSGFGQQSSDQQSSLFGQQLSQPNTGALQPKSAQNSLFGSTQTNSLFGAQKNSYNVPLLNNTRYTELNDDQQKFLDNLNKSISLQIHLAEDTSTRLTEIASLVGSVPLDVEELLIRISRIQTNSQVNEIELDTLRNAADQDFSKFEVCARQIQAIQNSHQALDNQINDPIFSQIEAQCDEIESKINALKDLILNMEQYLDEIEKIPENHSEHTIASVMKKITQTFLLLSNIVAELHDEVKNLKS